jgi:outer membrane lipopolysaccharide assembly protein LptE/RlpB
MKSRFTRSKLTVGPAALALLAVCFFQMPGAHGATTTVTKAVKIGVGLDDRNATKDQLAREIRQQLNSRGVRVSEKEVQTAATNALNLIAESKDPQKGVIYVKTKKFTFCVSWGSDKAFCKSH